MSRSMWSCDWIRVVRLAGRVLECPEGAGLAEAALFPERAVVGIGAIGTRDRQLTSLLVGELSQNVVLEPLDVVPAQLVQIPDALTVQSLAVDDEHLEDDLGARIRADPLQKHVYCTRVVLAQSGDEVTGCAER